MFPIFVLLACAPSDDSRADVNTELADTAEQEELVIPLPEIWGPAPVQDRVETGDLVEIGLTAMVTEQDWFGEGSFEGWTYDGQWPGPLIQIRQGQTLRVNFQSELDEPTTIHWHGLRIEDAMDGVPAIQDPVEPGEGFTYEFTPPDPGTYWYHPHVRSHAQIERGLHGMLIVHEADAPVVDQERAFVLDDILLDTLGRLESSEIVGMESVHGRLGNRLLVNGSLEALSGELRDGAVERWRLVNTANARTLQVTVVGARWRVIGVDGTLLPEPYEARYLYMPVGRRFDLEVIAEEETVQLQVLLPADGGGTTELVVFTGTVDDEPSEVSLDGEWLDWGAAPLPELKTPRQSMQMEFDGFVDNDELVTWTINGQSWGDHEVMEVDGHTPTQITLRDVSGRPHPFHLHGQFFQVISRNGNPPMYPGLLDTVQMSGNDEVVIQTDFDNPGLWMAHCHILEHAERGMMTQIRVSD
jgi:FtsP/CotA-like multicopper oxidase with cupredoxin domain